MKWTRFLVLLLGVGLYAANSVQVPPPSPKAVDDQNFNITVGEAWNYVSNYGSLGGDFNNGSYGYDWPGGGPHNYYLWGSYFTIGVKVGDNYYVTAHNYPRGEWQPSTDPPTFVGPRNSAWDVITAMDDFKNNPYNSPGRHTGIKVIIHTLAWPHEPYNDFIAHEFYITYVPEECDIGATPPAQLDSVFLGMWYDADVCGYDQSDPHIDDLVMFDGWTNGEWRNPDFIHQSPVDSVTVLPDSVLPEPDGVYDEYFIWGDEPDFENLVNPDHAWDIQWRDTTIHGYLVPRGISYIFDGDNPAVPGDDRGESNACAGFIGGIWVYAPPAPSDSIWTVGGDTLRLIRPWSHQWWNWESDPATDDDIYRYLAGRHPATQGYRYAPHPYDLGAAEFDYRFLSTVGPYTLRPGDTLKFVWVVGVGNGLNGSEDNFWGRGWVRGLRQVMEWAVKAYYSGAEFSDPAHPTPPDVDKHWKIPVPPAAPGLRYTTTGEGIALVWDDYAERTPDPIKGVVDVVGYRVYRATFAPSNWVLLADFGRDPNTGTFPHEYVDSTASPGFPYYYVVVAYDNDSLESPKSNYLKDADGNPMALTMSTPPGTSLDQVKVVPNPYNGSAPWTATEIADKVEFINLPPQARITIYTLSGDLVKEIIHSSPTGSEAWNLLSRSGQKVVSGVYIYKVETPDGQYKIGKLMILK